MPDLSTLLSMSAIKSAWGVLKSLVKFWRLAKEHMEMKEHIKDLEPEHARLNAEIKRLTVPDDLADVGHCLFRKLENGVISEHPYCPKCFLPLSDYLQCKCGFELSRLACSESVNLLQTASHNAASTPR